MIPSPASRILLPGYAEQTLYNIEWPWQGHIKRYWMIHSSSKSLDVWRGAATSPFHIRTRLDMKMYAGSTRNTRRILENRYHACNLWVAQGILLGYVRVESPEVEFRP